MRFTYLWILLWIFSACTATHELLPSPEKLSVDKIRNNHTDAQNAITEYKALQKQRTLDH